MTGFLLLDQPGGPGSACYLDFAAEDLPLHYLPARFSTAKLIVSTPVLRLGSGTG
jgi:hypothetical protein